MPGVMVPSTSMSRTWICFARFLTAAEILALFCNLALFSRMPVFTTAPATVGGRYMCRRSILLERAPLLNFTASCCNSGQPNGGPSK